MMVTTLIKTNSKQLFNFWEHTNGSDTNNDGLSVNDCVLYIPFYYIVVKINNTIRVQ